jgi:hypothetical protein
MTNRLQQLASAGLLTLALCGSSDVAFGQHGDRLDADRIAAAAGTKATTTKDGVVRLLWPRTDVAVSVEGVPIEPLTELSSWAGFTATSKGAMLMGDTVVFQDEVSPAMDAAFAHGLEVTALHNHFFFDQPKVYFMHIGGHGDPEKMAAGVKAIWDSIKEHRSKSPVPAEVFPGGTPQSGTLDAMAIEKIVEHPVEKIKATVRLTLGREGGRMEGVAIGGSIGLMSWATWSGSDDLAAVAGDFCSLGPEVQPILRAMRKAGIHIVSLHNHMIGEEPKYYFIHFWGKGPATDLARGIRSALDAQARAGKETSPH